MSENSGTRIEYETRESGENELEVVQEGTELVVGRIVQTEVGYELTDAEGEFVGTYGTSEEALAALHEQ